VNIRYLEKIRKMPRKVINLAKWLIMGKKDKKNHPKGRRIRWMIFFILSWHLGYPVGYRYIITEVFGFEDKKF